MRWHGAVLQPTRDVEPGKPILVQDEWSVARDAIQSRFMALRLISWFFLGWEIRLIAAHPLTLSCIPPNELFALAPRVSVRPCAGPIIYNATISRPGEAPTMAKIIS